MPLLILLTRNFYHRCSVCLAEVGCDNKLIGVGSLQDKVIAINIGEFGLVLTRKIVLGMLLTFLLIFTVYIQFDAHGGHHHVPIVKIDVSWENFLKECGRDSLEKGGGIQAIHCDQTYVEKTVVDWHGYLERVDDYRENFFNYMPHAIALMVKMQPTESQFHPDFVLALDTEKANMYSDLIASLNRGSELIINATIMTVGSIAKQRHLHLVELKKGEGFIELPAHSYDLGRYAEKPKLRGEIVVGGA